MFHVPLLSYIADLPPWKLKRLWLSEPTQGLEIVAMYDWNGAVHFYKIKQQIKNVFRFFCTTNQIKIRLVTGLLFRLDLFKIAVIEWYLICGDGRMDPV